MGSSDWTRLHYYYAAIAEAIHGGFLPLYYAGGIDSEWLTYLWAHPSAPILPYVLLLAWVTPGHLAVGVTLTYYVVGALGVRALARRAKWSPAVTGLAGVLLLGNGALIDNLSVGHDAFVAAFLFPWWCLLVWSLVDGRPVRHADLGLGLLLSVAMLGGAAHLVLWWTVALGLAVATQPCVWGVVLRGGAWFVLLSATRLVPMVVAYPLEALKYYPAWFGFPTWAEVWTALIGGQPALRAFGPFMWDRSCYLGPWALAFVISAGVIGPWFFPNRRRVVRLWLALIPSALALAGTTTAAWHDSANPLLAAIFSDRFGTRLLMMPVTVAIVLGCDTLQQSLCHLPRWWQRQGSITTVLVSLAIAWQFSAYMEVMKPHTRSIPTPPPAVTAPTGDAWGVMPIALVTHSTHPDLTYNDMYRHAVQIGTLLSIAGVLLMLTHYRRKDL